MAKELRFRVTYRQFKAGDPVPGEWGEGVRQALVNAMRAEWVEVAEDKAIDAPPADKMVRPNRVKRKGGE
jgi:hypothetical protein